MADVSRRALRPHRRFEGLVLSSEGRSARARVRKALEPRGQARPDWEIICDPVSYTHLTLPTNREV